MRTYSPCDNVTPQAYPAILVTTSLNDSQAMYWKPAKWVAKLRTMKTDDRPLYLKTNMAGGHGGSSGRYDRLRETAFRYAFMLDQVGLAGTGGRGPSNRSRRPSGLRSAGLKPGGYELAHVANA
jgi:oligopeptidase B